MLRKVDVGKVLATGTILVSCETESIPEPCSIAVVDTMILSGSSLEFSFGDFGDEEGVMITSCPAHAETCTLLNEPWEERILRYVPEEGFLGSDSVAVTATRGWDGSSTGGDTVTTTIAIQVVQDELHRKLTSRWEWTRSCGGFTGGCWNPDNRNSTFAWFAGDTLLIQGGDFVEEYVKAR